MQSPAGGREAGRGHGPGLPACCCTHPGHLTRCAPGRPSSDPGGTAEPASGGLSAGGPGKPSARRCGLCCWRGVSRSHQDVSSSDSGSWCCGPYCALPPCPPGRRVLGTSPHLGPGASRSGNQVERGSRQRGPSAVSWPGLRRGNRLPGGAHPGRERRAPFTRPYAWVRSCPLRSATLQGASSGPRGADGGFVGLQVHTELLPGSHCQKHSGCRPRSDPAFKCTHTVGLHLHVFGLCSLLDAAGNTGLPLDVKCPIRSECLMVSGLESGDQDRAVAPAHIV